MGLYKHTIQFSKEIEEELVGKVKKPIYKINIEANRGEKAFICDREKDRKQTNCIKKEDWKVFEVMQLQK